MKPTLIDIADGPGAAAYVKSFADADSPRRVLLIENPGGPATMLARRITAQLGPLSDEEVEEQAWIRFGARICPTEEGCFARLRPFRAPHHTLSAAAMFGAMGRPGELSLAHAGVLFLDEITEFRSTVLAGVFSGKPCLLTPYPCKPTADPAAYTAIPSTPRVLVATSTPCPCGYLGCRTRSCTCSPARVLAHVERQQRRRFHHVVRLRAAKSRFDPTDWTELQELPIARRLLRAV